MSPRYRPSTPRFSSVLSATLLRRLLGLPEKWLSEGDGATGKDFAGQISYGSDILLLKRLP
jgi:hypothetical protein